MNETNKVAEIHKIEVLDSFQESRSAKKPNNRPVFTEMMSRVYKGQVNCLIVWKLDRLARNPLDAAAVMMALQDGLIEKIVTPMRTYHRSDNVLLMQIEFGMANQYIRDLSQNVKRGMKTKAGKGGWNHLATLGYKNDKSEKIVIIDNERAPFIELMFKMRGRGESCYEIARVLYQMGFRSRTGKRVRQNVINRYLRSRFYLGEVLHEGEWVAGSHEAIVTYAQWQKAQTKKPLVSKSNHDFALLGTFECGECGCSITAEKQKGYIYYRCTKKRGKCSQRYFRSDKLEEELLRFFNGLTMSEELSDIISDFAEVKFKDVNQEKIRLTKKWDSEIKKMEKELDTLLEMRKGGELDKEEYLKEKAICKKKLENLMGDRFKNREEIQSNLEDIVEWLELMKTFGFWAKGISTREWRNLLNSFGSNFYIKEKSFSLSGFTPLFKAIKEENPTWWRKGDSARTLNDIIDIFLEDIHNIKNILEIKRRVKIS